MVCRSGHCPKKNAGGTISLPKFLEILRSRAPVIELLLINDVNSFNNKYRKDDKTDPEIMIEHPIDGPAPTVEEGSEIIRLLGEKLKETQNHKLILQIAEAFAHFTKSEAGTYDADVAVFVPKFIEILQGRELIQPVEDRPDVIKQVLAAIVNVIGSTLDDINDTLVVLLLQIIKNADLEMKDQITMILYNIAITEKGKPIIDTHKDEIIQYLDTIKGRPNEQDLRDLFFCGIRGCHPSNTAEFPDMV